MEVNQNEFFDLFNMDKSIKEELKPTFSTEEEQDLNLFSEKKEEVVEEVIDTRTDLEKLQEEEKPAVEDLDILQQQKPGRKPKYEFNDISGYFQDRITKGVFSGLVDEEGKDIELKAPEDFDNLIEANINFKLEQKSKELEQTWYQTKTPAWKAVAQYAELVDEPSQLIPFIQGVNNIQSISSIDTTTIEGAEQIVRYRLQLSGDDEETIDNQIDSLKTTDRLIALAEKYKPTLVQNEQKRLAVMQQEESKKVQDYIKVINENLNLAYEEIEKPLFGEKLKKEEKAAVYDLIAQPDEELGGYPIFAKIDELYEKKDFSTLKEIALLLNSKEGFYKYAQKASADKTAAKLQTKLRVQMEQEIKSTGNDDPEVTKGKIPASYVQKGKPRFGN